VDVKRYEFTDSPRRFIETALQRWSAVVAQIVLYTRHSCSFGRRNAVITA